MTNLKRLERLMPVLSARETFLLALAQYREGRQVEVDGRHLSRLEAEDYRSRCRLVIALNEVLETLFNSVRWRAEWLGFDLERREGLAEAAMLIEEAEGLPPGETPRDWRREGELTAPAFLRGLAKDTKESVAAELDGLSGWLAAAREVRREVAEVIGDEALHVHTEGLLEGAEAAVADLRQRLGLKRPARPRETLVTQLREAVEAHAEVLMMPGAS